MSATNSTDQIKRIGLKPVRRYWGLMLLLPALLVIGCVSITTDGEYTSDETDETPTHSFTVGDNPTIDVSGFNGEIVILTGADGEIRVDATLKIPSRISYSATQVENTVEVVATRVGSGITFGRSPQATIQIVIPAETTVKAQTKNGRITIDGVSGLGELKTSNGVITMTDITGTYVASTSNGSIFMDNVSGQFIAETSNGRINFTGSLDQDGDNRFTTSNGSIDVVFSDEPSVDIDARTSNGTIKTDRPILTTKMEKNHLVGMYGEGLAELELRTSNGSIDIK